MTKPVCVIRLNNASMFEEALARCDLAEQFEVHSFKPGQPIPKEVAARTEVFFAHAPGGYLNEMPNLKWVQVNSAGVEPWINKDLRRDIILTSGRGAHRISMPESIIGALFLITKQYAHAVLAQRESKWSKYVPETLTGKTLGILGIGEIGKELARKADALELRVIGAKRSPSPVPHVEAVYGPEETDQVLRQSDFVVVLLPSTSSTENFINAERLRAMKSTAWLLNFARGATVVDDDLIAAIKSKQIAGAVLDTFREEPLPAAHPFWKTEGIFVTPHVGGGGPLREAKVAEIFIENARNFLAGRRPFRNEIDHERGY